MLYDELRDVAKKTTVFVPMATKLTHLEGSVLKDADRVSIVIPPMERVRNCENLIKTLESQGIDNLEAYLIFDSSSDPAEVLQKAERCMSLGMSITVGPFPFDMPFGDVFLEAIGGRKDVDLGLHYGSRYMYTAMRIFLHDYPLTILMSPASPCRVLYVNPMGMVSKCPSYGSYVSYDEATLDVLRKMFFSPCPVRESLVFTPRIDISFVSSTGVKIPADVMELLEIISQVKSFRAACKAMGVSPSTYWERIKGIERRIGRPLVISMKGGRKKGVTVLTGIAIELVEEYKRVRERVLLSMYGK